jgi:uncharacterized protein (DUF1778 family)
MAPQTKATTSRHTKNERIQIRVSDERRARYEAAAAVQGQSLTEFVTEAADMATEHTLADRRTFLLDDDAWNQFNAQLDAPPKVVPGLVDLFARPDVFGGTE